MRDSLASYLVAHTIAFIRFELMRYASYMRSMQWCHFQWRYDTTRVYNVDSKVDSKAEYPATRQADINCRRSARKWQ